MKRLEIQIKMNIQENISLKDYTTFKLGGKAKYFAIAKTINDIQQAVQFAKDKKLKVFILAGGSNLIVSDDGFDGLVIKIDIAGIRFRGDKVTVGAGTVIEQLVNECNKRGLAGLEWAGGLPGTVGGAARGNAGAFGGEIKDCVLEVRSLELEDTKSQIIKRNNSQCLFSYRSSIFKHNNEIILEVELQLKKADSQMLQATAQEHRHYRQEKHPIEFGCAGSIFKNIPIKNVSAEVKEQFKDVIKTDPLPVIPTAAVIDRVGLTGHKVGDAQISEKHPNYIINLGNAKAEDVIELIELEVKTIREKYGVSLEVEPQLLGFKQHFAWEDEFNR